MEDMVIKGTGNSRFLKSVENFLDLFPTYEAFAAAFAAGILPVDFNGINPEGITQMGTPYAKSSVLADETAALFGFGATAIPDDIFKKIVSGFNMTGPHFIQNNEVLHTGNIESLNMAQIVTGSYVGTGTYGSNNKNVLTLSIRPRLLIVAGEESMMIAAYGAEHCLFFYSVTGTSSNVQVNNISWGDNTVQWYNENSSYGAKFQMNTEKAEYHYTVIG